MTSKQKVLLAMSGGIDSSIAAIILQEQGYDVTGITLKICDYNNEEIKTNNFDYIKDARLFADKLKFPHFTLDIRKKFEDLIINNFVDEYLAGRTPNPCILCNAYIKWQALIEKASQLNCKYIATGHYAKIRYENNRYIISKGVDKNKDQSYMLWALSQEKLKNTLFPLGDYNKEEIKKIAVKNNFDDLVKKRESYDVCFIPDNDYPSFLNKKRAGLEKKFANGNFISVDGKILGKHKGYPYYTIGQRKGLNIAVGRPLYVKEIDPKTNTVTLADKIDISKKQIYVKNFNSVKYPSIPDNINVITKVRYRNKGTLSILNVKKDIIKVNFKQDAYAIASGQSAVFYENNDIVGGGIIV